MSLMFAFAAVASMQAVSADDPRFTSTRARSDGVILYCIQHSEKPSVFTPLNECNTLARWKRVLLQRSHRTPITRDPSVRNEAHDA